MAKAEIEITCIATARLNKLARQMQEIGSEQFTTLSIIRKLEKKVGIKDGDKEYR